jgi:hypothetical protein
MIHPPQLNAVIPNVTTGQVVPNSPECFMHRMTGNLAYVEKTFAGTSGAASTNIFQITGNVELLACWGVMTDVTNVTAITVASWNLYDGTNTVDITKASGTTLSGAGLYSTINKTAVAGTALSFNNSTQCRLMENATGARTMYPCIIAQKAATGSFIWWTNTTGAVESFRIMFYAAWVCRDAGRSNLVAV